MSINKVILIGNVVEDPAINYIKEDVPVAKLTLATSETFKNKAGEKVDNTEWHNIVIWRGLAKVVEKYVKKGNQLYLEGKITNISYEKDGVTKYFTQIVCHNMQMLGGKSESNTQKEPSKQVTNQSNDNQEDDSLPF